MYKILASRGTEEFIVEYKGKLNVVRFNSGPHVFRGVPCKLTKNEARSLLGSGFIPHNPQDEIGSLEELTKIALIFSNIRVPQDWHNAILLYKEGKRQAISDDWEQLRNEVSAASQETRDPNQKK